MSNPHIIFIDRRKAAWTYLLRDVITALLALALYTLTDNSWLWSSAAIAALVMTLLIMRRTHIAPHLHSKGEAIRFINGLDWED